LLVNSSSREGLHKRLIEAIARQQDRVRCMWNRVDDLLDSPMT